MIKPRRMRWAEHVARMVKMRNAYKIFAGKPEGKRPFGGVDDMIILERISGK
jgi:hypothetical protein